MKFSCPIIRQWDVDEGHVFWDSALAGSPSLRSAVLRTLKLENGVTRGAWAAHMLWDMANFYDSIRLPILVTELAKRNFPTTLLVLGVLTHAAPRILRVGPSLGPIVHSCGKSVLAGCQLSTSWVRGLLYELMERLSRVDPEHPPNSHVDDISHVVIAESEAELKTTLLAAGCIMGDEVQRLQLSLSDK